MDADARECLINIGPRGRRQRLHMGIAALLVTVPIGAAMVALLPARAPRAFLMLPLWIAGLGIFQARGKT